MANGILNTQLKGSNLGLKGTKPETREDALSTSQLHAQGSAPAAMKGEHSVFDLDGKKPATYRDNAPEGASF
jgi:hypothetical protein